MNILKEIVANTYKYFAPNVFKTYINKIGKENQLITGITSKSAANLLFSLCAFSIKPNVIIVEDGLKAEELLREIKVYDLKAEIFGPKEYRNFDVESESRESYIDRMRVLRDIERKRVDIVIVPVKALFQQMIPLKELFSKKITFKTAEYFEKRKIKPENYELEDVVNKLVQNGYVRETKTENEGSFSLKGGILDIGLNKEKGVRLEFWGDEIESIRKFNIDTQRSTEKTEFIEIYPAYENVVSEKNIKTALDSLEEKKNSKKYIKEISDEIQKDIERIKEGKYFNIIEKYLDSFYEETESLFNYLAKLNVNIIYLEIHKLHLRTDNIEKDRLLNEEYIVDKHKYIPYYFSSEKINYLNSFKEIYTEKSTYLNSLNLRNTHIPDDALDSKIKIIEKDLGKDIKVFIDNIKIAFKKYKQIIIFSKKTEEIKNILKENGIPAKIIQNEIKEEILQGFNEKHIYEKYLKEEKNQYAIDEASKYTENISTFEKEILIYPKNLDGAVDIVDAKVLFAGFEKNKIRTKRQYFNKSFRDSQKIFFGDLAPGDFVVHKVYGIGKFKKIDQVTVMGVTKEYLKIEYANNNYLYVPITNADVVRKYIGAGVDGLKLNSLDGKAWEKTKNKLRKNLREVAGELIKLYSEREKNKGYAFAKDTSWQKEFENKFEYIETDDQLRCIKEIKEDMEKDLPMDRLLCGDVGFGKTEVAQRAAFKAVMEGKQVAYLAPTTILVKQQYEGFVERFKEFPVEIDYVSRMKTTSKNNETLKRVKEGKVDILIGTHRLLSSDVSFKDLGLLIIDEEHRFGVKAKEKIKFLKKQVDVLSMSATPIPRTLSMSLSGIRDMSVIYEAPKNRKPVKTFLLEYDKNIIDEAILSEIERSGQVFYIHNRVKTIGKVYEELSSRLKNVKFGVAHGQMSAKEIEKVMSEFVDGKIDVLISTSIVETGIDIENANTMIIEDADRLGLAQLYQIRGRVGRGKKKAYAYLTFKKNKNISENAEKRLKAIKDFTELGSGYKIALRDLEIRGAGSVLGEMQHGHIEQVGYDMYVKILNEVISEVRNEEPEKEIPEVKIDLNIESYIPDNYIMEKEDKIEIYQKIADAKTEDEYKELEGELEDRFGKIPNELIKLIEISKIKHSLEQKGFSSIKQRGKIIRMFYTEDYNPEKLLELAKTYTYSKKFKISNANFSVDLILSSLNDFDVIKEIQEFLEKI